MTEADLPTPQPGDGPFVECVCRLTEAHLHLVQGDPDRGSFLAGQVRRQAVREEYFFFEGEALLIRLYADLALGRELDIARGVEELSNVATALQSQRYAILSRLVGTALSEEPDVPVLLATATKSDASPMAARVASRLLGGPDTDDALDRVLLDGLPLRWTSAVIPLNPGTPAAWVFEPATRMIHLPNRSYKASPLAVRLLESLFVGGGEASLEDVARRGWDLEDYHQLRDSKRVHVAIGRLRRVLEDEPSSPARVVTTRGGYGFGASQPPGVLRPMPGD